MKTADLIVRQLEQEGVQQVYCLPGEEILDLCERFRTSSLRVIVTRHEQAAAMMAATEGRLTGKPGLCLVTLGPGATNVVTAAQQATSGGWPVVILAGQKPIRRGGQGLFQFVDLVQEFRHATKFASQVLYGDSAPYQIRNAFRIAEEEKPGAALVVIPEDIAEENTSGDVVPVHPLYRPCASEQAIRGAVARIEAAHRPLVLIGAACNRAANWEAAKELRAFIDKTSIPFFTTQMGKGVVDEFYPLFLGTAALSAGTDLHRAIDRGDLVISVGHDITEKPPFIMIRGGPEVIHVNYLAALVDPIYFPQAEVVGDIPDAMRRMTERITRQPSWDFSFLKG